MMEPGTSILFVGVLFLLLAIVGGGFSVKEITVPAVPKWARVVSAILGIAFVLLFVFTTLAISLPAPSPNAKLLYSDKQPDTTPHAIEFVQLEARAAHNPPLIKDVITVKFSIRNVGSTATQLDSGTFISVRKPNGQNFFVPRLNANKTIQPNEVVEMEASVPVDIQGTWVLGPCYKITDNSINNGFCPDGWKQFVVDVQ